MKKLLIAVFALVLGISANSIAKDAFTKVSFKVSGNCDMCKKKIEKAAKIEGVKAAEWNQDTKILTVAFAPAKTTLDDIQKSIAKAGYDTEKFKADVSDYNKLHQCCQYEREK